MGVSLLLETNSEENLPKRASKDRNCSSLLEINPRPSSNKFKIFSSQVSNNNKMADRQVDIFDFHNDSDSDSDSDSDEEMSSLWERVSENSRNLYNSVTGNTKWAAKGVCLDFENLRIHKHEFLFSSDATS